MVSYTIAWMMTMIQTVFTSLLLCGLVLSIAPFDRSQPTMLSLQGGWASASTNADDAKEEDGNHVISELIDETGFYQSIRLMRSTPLFQKQSLYQKIEVHQSEHYGRILVLDGVVQLTERDADSYNEMLAHLPMFQHKHPQRVLVIGGGDGYVLSEILKHPSVTHVDHVDLDGDVVETCREHFAWGKAWEDPRVKLHIADGAAFVRDALDASYDVIVQDSSDPWTWSGSGEKVVLPSSALYSDQHFMNISRILKPNGVLAIQAESLQIPSDLNGIRQWRNLALRSGFQSARYSSIMISSYPTGQIGILCCEKDTERSSTSAEVKERFEAIVKAGRSTTYYHPPLQTSSFVLPLWAQQYIYGESWIEPDVNDEL